MATWQYYLDKAMDGKSKGWHYYDSVAGAKLEECWKEKIVEGATQRGKSTLMSLLQSPWIATKLTLA